jgi:hypothetical protein
VLLAILKGSQKMSTTVLATPKRPQIKTALPGPNGKKIVEADAQFVNPS